jgi:hypothetical protein
MDILIDGPYIESLNDDSGLRGSSNQRVHILKPNPKYEGFNFESNPRIIEYLPKLELRDGNLINTEEFAGIPSIQFTRLWRRENG